MVASITQIQSALNFLINLSTQFSTYLESSSVGTATGYEVDDRATGIQFLAEARKLLFSTMSRQALGSTQPHIQCKRGTFSLKIKWLGCEANHSPPSTADIKNAWIYSSTPPNTFMMWCLINQEKGLHYFGA
jgi:hypothetical protein